GDVYRRPRLSHGGGWAGDDRGAAEDSERSGLCRPAVSARAEDGAPPTHLRPSRGRAARHPRHPAPGTAIDHLGGRTTFIAWSGFSPRGCRAGMKIAFFGSSLVSSYWNGAATYYRGIL